MVKGGGAGGLIVNVKFCVAFGEVPFCAVKVIGNVPLAVGVPLRVPALNVTPSGSAPDSLMLGAGVPVAVTVNEPAVPSTKVVLFALVMAGAWVEGGGGFCVVELFEPPHPDNPIVKRATSTVLFLRTRLWQIIIREATLSGKPRSTPPECRYVVLSSSCL
jgi:hypothetical protein